MRARTSIIVLLLMDFAVTAYGIEPYSKNPWYWQRDWGDGTKPVLLLGGSSEDNPYQWAGANFD